MKETRHSTRLWSIVKQNIVERWQCSWYLRLRTRGARPVPFSIVVSHFSCCQWLINMRQLKLTRSLSVITSRPLVYRISVNLLHNEHLRSFIHSSQRERVSTSRSCVLIIIDLLFWLFVNKLFGQWNWKIEIFRKAPCNEWHNNAKQLIRFDARAAKWNIR